MYLSMFFLHLRLCLSPLFMYSSFYVLKSVLTHFFLKCSWKSRIHQCMECCGSDDEREFIRLHISCSMNERPLAYLPLITRISGRLFELQVQKNYQSLTPWQFRPSFQSFEPDSSSEKTSITPGCCVSIYNSWKSFLSCHHACCTKVTIAFMNAFQCSPDFWSKSKGLVPSLTWCCYLNHLCILWCATWPDRNCNLQILLTITSCSSPVGINHALFTFPEVLDMHKAPSHRPSCCT